jgi:hypothetical protein
LWRFDVAKDQLDQLKYRISCEVVARFTIQEIRQSALANLDRWRAGGTWGQAYEQWLKILTSYNDEALKALILGTDEKSIELRQSMPYVGMLKQEVVRRVGAAFE